MSDLSILLVTRNAMPWVADAIAQANAEPAAQVIAVDGASTDGTRQLLAAQTHWLVHDQRATGLAAARNEAVALATGEYLAFLDADDVWLAGKTAAQVRYLDSHPEPGLVSCQMTRVGPGQPGLAQPAWTPSGCVIRREVFERVGGFDERLRLACDTDWFIRARGAGVRAHLLDEVLMHKRIHAANLSHDRATYRRELAQVLSRAAR